jgi:hypothetical protein
MIDRILLSIITAMAGWCMLADAAPDEIDFNRDIRPILSDRCFKCHGPDVATREGKLGLDTRTDATRELPNGNHAVVPGKPQASELVYRVTTEDADDRMPPADSGLSVSTGEAALLARWIKEGAAYSTHWALSPPSRPKVPTVSAKSPRHNAIDHFVQRRLKEAGLNPNQQADPYALARRVYLDLTGVPPTVEEADAFVQESSSAAYEQMVDRLMASPRYGERWARWWLDLARYADTNGYESDEPRTQWAYRDWLIHALNANMPFDQFTIEQLAGDLLPDRTIDQRIATGFHRNSLINTEGGAKNDEFKDAAIKDRVETTGTVWLGATLLCSQCHDHKYDPISQKDYYSLYSIFNNTTDKAVVGESDKITVFSGDRGALAALERQVASAQAELGAKTDALLARDRTWERSLAETLKDGGLPVLLDVKSAKATSGTVLTRQHDGSFLSGGPEPATETYEFTCASSTRRITGFQLEALPDKSLERDKGGLSRGNGNFVLSRFEVRVQSPGETARPVKLVRAVADFSQGGLPAGAAINSNNDDGWAVYPTPKEQSRTAVFFPETPLETAPGTMLTIRLVHESKYAKHIIGRPRLSVFSHPDPQLPGAGGTAALGVAEALAVPGAKRTPKQRAALRQYYQSWAVELSSQRAAVDRAQTAVAAFKSTSQTTTTMVMIEGKPVQGHVQTRGEFLQPGVAVDPGVPSAFGLNIKPVDGQINRLDLARWLVDPRHPRTSRVTVNRLWGEIFGIPIVATPEDFGYQSDWPTHPKLLDWLATEFVEQGWDMKGLIKMIVMSATYRQSSAATPEQLGKDYYNRLLGRGPRFRAEAEMIRDIALTAGGILHHKVGGPSVFPPQPAVIYETQYIEGGFKTWPESKGRDRYRRGLYTFVKRTALYPLMSTFDAPSRAVCNVARKRSNTPLQALNTLNDPVFVEAAGGLARHIMVQPKKLETRLVYGFRRCATRPPRGDEMQALATLYARTLATFKAEPKSAAAILKAAGITVPSADSAEMAAWIVVANALLNMDATLTKG